MRESSALVIEPLAIQEEVKLQKPLGYQKLSQLLSKTINGEIDPSRITNNLVEDFYEVGFDDTKP